VRADNCQQLNQAIARQLETDKDIAIYRSLCRSTWDAVDADNGSFWRARFREKYALRNGRSNAELMDAYQRRRKQLRHGSGYDFFRGHARREVDVVEVLKELIVGMWCTSTLYQSFELIMSRIVSRCCVL
jgi:hypothetical protein